MFDFKHPTNYERNRFEIEEFCLFGLCVAGKTAKMAATGLDRFLAFQPNLSPFAAVRTMLLVGSLEDNLRKAKLGQYNRLKRGMEGLSRLDVTVPKVEALEKVYGIGPKTSRFVVLHCVSGAQLAVLDTHILAYLRAKGFNAPRTTPGARTQYMELEQAFLKLAKQQGKTPAQLDAEIWLAASDSAKD